ncbi:redoxin domain-containing protein [Chryseolinea sp. T2]|uniref:redoxin domain-containing protein n=1 Tax=Chryseolinea sp. T2 TaxID=3129255 RepID=UPI003077AE07
MLNIFICAQFLAGFCLAFAHETVPQRRDKQALRVYVFLGTDCPISQDYVGVLNEMTVRYKDRVTFMGFVPDTGRADEIKEFKDEYEVKFDLASDKNMSMIKSYNVHSTPEVVLLDNDNVVQYQGAIDNWYYSLGKHRQSPTENYLKDAIEGLLSGKAVEIRRTEVVGCIINMTHVH